MFFGSIWKGGLAFCVFFFAFVARRGFAGVGEMRWASRLVDAGGSGGDSEVPIAVLSYRVSPAAYQGWMSAQARPEARAGGAAAQGPMCRGPQISRTT